MRQILDVAGRVRKRGSPEAGVLSRGQILLMLTWDATLTARKGNNMAKIWPVYDGKVPTIGQPWAELPLTEAMRLFEL